MPYAEGQDLSVPYAECSPDDQVVRDREAMRAMVELSIGCNHYSSFHLQQWEAGLVRYDDALDTYTFTETGFEQAANPADAILLAARELEGTDEKQG